MRDIARKLKVGLLVCSLVAVALLSGGWPLLRDASAAPLQERSLMLSDNAPSATGIYNISMTPLTSGTIGSIMIEVCANTALFLEPCDPPAGFTDAAAVLATQTGITGFTISGASTDNVIILTRTPTAVTGGTAANFIFNNVTNPNYTGSFFARFSTFATDDATGPSTDLGSIATATQGPLGVTTEVPPYLLFCAGTTITNFDCTTADGDYINFGTLASTHSSSGEFQLLTGTNAQNGYSISMTGSSMTSGNNVIDPLSSPTPSAPGISQFGINLRANSDPAVGKDPTGPGTGVPTADYNQPNRYKFVPNDTIVTNPTVENFRKYTISYLVNVNKNQPPGVYASTFTYVCVANF